MPADVTVTATLYPNSSADPQQVKSLTYGGKATPGGIFGAAQGMRSFVLEAPGEYHARLLATYTDPDGHLWVCSMRHAGVVYPVDSNLIAHGKMVKVQNSLVERGGTHHEGYVAPNDGFRNLDHINFPYKAGDVLLIASEGDGANKIEPVLTYEIKDGGQKYAPKLQPIGNTNVRIATSNGMSTHLYPEYITDLAYYYGAGPRPGFMSRFVVGEDGVRAPYWPTSATNFGGQFGATNNRTCLLEAAEEVPDQGILAVGEAQSGLARFRGGWGWEVVPRRLHHQDRIVLVDDQVAPEIVLR